MGLEDNYIRVGTTIYRNILKPLLSEKEEMTLVPWNIETIKQDHPNNWKELIKNMDKYYGFCTIPTHQNYQREFKGHYNRYDPIPCPPEEGECNTILSFVEHIFEEHYELGMDYLQLLSPNHFKDFQYCAC